MKKRIQKTLLIILVTLTAVCVVLLLCFFAIYGKRISRCQALAKTIAMSSVEADFRSIQTSVIYAGDGEILSVIKSDKDVYYISYEDIPKLAIQTMITTEDQKFYSHNGIDLLANIRAVYSLIKNKGIYQGGSTITQQLARNVYLSTEVTLDRKLTEIFLAPMLERKYTKQQILEFYFNNIYFANGYYGLQAASKGYFNKSVKELTIGELVFLCTIPNNPTIYNPKIHYQNTVERKNRILQLLYEKDVISKEEYHKGTSQKIILKEDLNKMGNAAEGYIFQCAIRSLMQKEGFIFQTSFTSKEEKEDYEAMYNALYYEIQARLYTNGYRIYTSIDNNKQNLLQKAVTEQLKGFTEVSQTGEYQLQGAAVCIDNQTGKVVAIVGGREESLARLTLNRAYQSYRQPGSAIKPLIVYTPWFERGLSLASIVSDEKFEGGPRNSNGVYTGEITVRRAIELSKNTVAWRLFEELNPKIGLEYLKAMHFSKIVDTDEVPAASLGGLTYGVSAVEMAAAYATIENCGSYRIPTCIIRITDAEGRSIVEDNITEEQIYETNAANMMTNALEGVMKEGTGKKLALSNLRSAGKTGTTNNGYDGWFVGYTKYYTTSVWVGYDYPKKVDGLSGNTYPGFIWRQYMNAIHTGYEEYSFPCYEDKIEADLQKDNNTETEDQEETQNSNKDSGDVAVEEQTEEKIPADGINNDQMEEQPPADDTHDNLPEEEVSADDRDDNLAEESGTVWEEATDFGDLEDDDYGSKEDEWSEPQWIQEQFDE